MYLEFLRYGFPVIKRFSSMFKMNEWIEENKHNPDIKIVKIFPNYKKEFENEN